MVGAVSPGQLRQIELEQQRAREAELAAAANRPAEPVPPANATAPTPTAAASPVPAAATPDISPGAIRQIDDQAAAANDQLQLEAQQPAVDQAVARVVSEKNSEPAARQAAQAELDDAVAGEVAVATNAELRVRAVPPEQRQAETDRLIQSYGANVAARYAGDPTVAAAIQTATTHYRAERWVQDGTTVANAKGTPDAAFASLAGSLQGAPAELQPLLVAEVRQSPQATRIVTDAAAWATRPAVDAPVAGAADTTARLSTLLAQPMPAAVRDMVTTAASDNLLASFDGRMDLVANIAGMQALTGALRADPATRLFADGLIPRLAASVRDGGPLVDPGRPSSEIPLQMAITRGVAQGQDPAFAIELARQYAASGDVYGAKVVLGAAIQGFEQFAGSPPQDAVETHGRTLAFLPQILQGAASPADAQAAIDAFYAGNPQATAARDTVAGFGESLINGSSQLGALPPELLAAVDVSGIVSPDGTVTPLPGARDPAAARQESLLGALDSPEAQMAVSVALNRNPALLDGPAGESFVSALGTPQLAKMGDQFREFAARVSGQYVDRVINNEIAAIRSGIDPTDRTGPGRLKQALQARLASMPDEVYNGLGVSRSTFDRAMRIIDADLPTPADSAAETIEKLQRIDQRLSNLTGQPGELLQDDSAGMRVLRTLGVAAGAVALGDALAEAVDNPDAQAYVSVMSEIANLSKGTAETLMALRATEPGGVFGFLAGQSETHAVASRAANRLLGIVGTAGDAANVIESLLAEGGPDYAKASLYGLGLAGTGVMALSSTAFAAGVGAPLVIASVLGVAQYERVQQSNEFDNQATRDALVAMRFDADAADSLADQSGDGYSAVAPLMAYAQSRGLTTEQARAWINGIDTARVDGEPSKLDRLRDNLHHTLDDIDGDLSRLPATDPDADGRFLSYAQPRGRAGSISSEQLILAGDRPVTSMRQIDDVLGVLGIEVPRAN